MLSDVVSDGDVEISIENFDEINFDKVGEKEVKFLLEDEHGIKKHLTSKLVIVDNKKDFRSEKKKIKKSIKKQEDSENNKAPVVKVKDINLKVNEKLSKKDLATKMIRKIEDDNDEIDKINIKVKNYRDIEFKTKGEYQIKFIVSDSQGLETSVNGKVIIGRKKENKKPTEEETTKEETTKEETTDVVDVDASLQNNTVVSADACSTSGSRVANAKADIGYGDREYYGYTNSSSQLVYVTADKLEIQNDSSEATKSTGRYCNDEAKVPGTEQSDLDEGHAIADSLGGVSNAYNITPQESTLNRHGEQYQMEGDIRDALLNGHTITDFEYTISYPNQTTQIPNHYDVKYYDNGSLIMHSFNNEYSESAVQPTTVQSEVTTQSEITTQSEMNNSVVYYQNCTEVKAAGAAPITANDPGWQSKFDRDGDGIGCDS